ncbi:uncharacterized protein BJX67DRAFT_380143 [Aspergillus lucknowensis]|uniref:Fe2OG dioxygenase domain-containing protein n=1 Tax=Aspergillus lucknowensis TaxID=176173 RepID=A0ABR4LUW2_9EURO
MPKPKPAKKDPRRPSKAQTQQLQTPNWPPLRPLIPSSDLLLEPLLPDQIYLIRNFLPASLCKIYVSFLSSIPLTTTPGKPKKGEAVRVNDRFQIQDPIFADILWRETALKELVTQFVTEDEQSQLTKEEVWGGEPLGLNANIRVYRYSPGQFFAQHYDDSNTLSFSSPSMFSPKPARTTWTLLIYLSICSGGETVFYPEPTMANRNPEPIFVPPEMGMALLHRHGDRCLLHEGREVVDGQKWVLRSDLVIAR